MARRVLIFGTLSFAYALSAVCERIFFSRFAGVNGLLLKLCGLSFVRQDRVVPSGGSWNKLTFAVVCMGVSQSVEFFGNSSLKTLKC